MVVQANLISGTAAQETIEKLRPRTEAVVDAGARTSDPVYFVLALTWISFVVAGLREELWRAGMLAAVQANYPGVFSGRWRS
jgi:hypothetical protein